MNIFLAFNNFLVYLRLHKGRSRKTQEQYVSHIWKFLVYILPDIAYIQVRSSRDEISGQTRDDSVKGVRDDSVKIAPDGSSKHVHTEATDIHRFYTYMDFLPPADTAQQRMWRSPLPYLPQYIDREIPDIEDIGRDDIDSFRLYLADSGLSVKTVNAYMITLRSWLKYLKKEQRETLDPTTIDLLKPPDRDVTFLTSEEVDTFFGYIPTDTTIWLRDYAICQCIYSTGLRISELVALDIADVNMSTMEFAVRGKGWKIRTVYLTDTAKDAIQAYLAVRTDDVPALYIRHNYLDSSMVHTPQGKGDIYSDNPHDKGGRGVKNIDYRLSRFFITNMVKSYGVRAGILKNMHAHTLRHSFATTLLMNGADIRIIQELLGHASITTTQVYTHVTNPKLKEAHKKYHV